MTSPLSIANHLAAAWNGRVPVMLGVTGHRDIDTQSQALCKAIREQCRALRRKYPSAPFVILSSLA